jgi:hypothetical protein
MVSVRDAIRETMNIERDKAADERALPSHWPIVDVNSTVTAFREK